MDKKHDLPILKKIRELISNYDKIENKVDLINHEELIEEYFLQLDNVKKKAKFRLSRKYYEIKLRKKFLIDHCVRCNSQKDMTYQEVTRKRVMRSGPVAIAHTVTYQHLDYNFPVCGECKKKINRIQSLDGLLLLISLGWIIGFGGYVLLEYFLAYRINRPISSELHVIFISIAAIGAIGFGAIGRVILRFLKYWPRRFIKIKVKFIGHGTPHRGKNYEGIPMIKPIDSKKWISYEKT